MLIDAGDEGVLVSIDRGRVTGITDAAKVVMPTWRFALRAPASEWEAFWAVLPKPGSHDLFALLRRKQMRVEGDLHPFMSNLLYFKSTSPTTEDGVMTAASHRTDLRADTYGWTSTASSTACTSRRPAIRYAAAVPSHRGRRHPPVPGIAERRGGARRVPRHHLRPALAWQVVAAGRLAETTYQLTAASTATILIAVIEALELDRPIAMGCSIGGA